MYMYIYIYIYICIILQPGTKVMAAARSCDLILLIMDATKPVTHTIMQ